MNYVYTVYGEEIPEGTLRDYIKRLTGRFFKILPLREQNYASLDVYLERFRKELIGSRQLIDCLSEDGRYITLITTVESLKADDCSIEETRSLVFDAISICNAIAEEYGGDEDGNNQ